MRNDLVRSCRTSLVLFAVTTLLTTAPRALAQAVFGQIVGTVTDSTDAVVPNATVTVTDVAKGTVQTLQANSAGQFTVDHLIPDIYKVKVAAAGFKNYEQDGIQVYADTSPTVRAVLQVGSSDQTIQVSAEDVPQLKTDRADVATELSAREIVDLPIPDRNFTNLQLLL